MRRNPPSEPHVMSTGGSTVESRSGDISTDPAPPNGSSRPVGVSRLRFRSARHDQGASGGGTLKEQATPHKTQHPPDEPTSSRPASRPLSGQSGETSTEEAFSVEIRQVRGDAAMEGVPERIQQARGGVSTALSLRSTRPGGERGKQTSQNKPRPTKHSTPHRPTRRLDRRAPAARRGETPMDPAPPNGSNRPVGVSRLRFRSARHDQGASGGGTLKEQATPRRPNVVSTRASTPIEATWRDLHGNSGFDRSWHTQGDVSTALLLRSTRPRGGRGQVPDDTASSLIPRKTVSRQKITAQQRPPQRMNPVEDVCIQILQSKHRSGESKPVPVGRGRSPEKSDRRRNPLFRPTRPRTRRSSSACSPLSRPPCTIVPR